MAEKCQHVCGHHSAVASVNQSLDEMDFERGIWSAALSDDIHRLKKFLENTNANDIDSSGYAALHYAARNGHLDACTLLLDHGARVNCCTRTGRATALMRAAYCGHLDVVKLLLSKGADPTLQDSDGKTALHKACENGHASIAHVLLLKNSQLISIADHYGNVAKSLVPSGNDQLLSLLREF